MLANIDSLKSSAADPPHEIAANFCLIILLRRDPAYKVSTKSPSLQFFYKPPLYENYGWHT